jgi:transcriptional regulator with XRE-family HTH domain
MHDGLGQAVMDLRREMNWTQPDLAKAMHKAARKRTGRPVTRHMITDWEHGKFAPSGVYRSALARVAMHEAESARGLKKERLGELAGRFSAPLASWKFHASMRRRESQNAPD